MIRTTAAIWLGGALALSAASPDPFTSWPSNSSPREVGLRVAENFAARPLEFEVNAKRHVLIYPEVCAWYGSLKVARAAGNKDLEGRLIKEFDRVAPIGGTNHLSSASHVDAHVSGALPLEIYLLDGDARCRDLGLGFADSQWKHTTDDGITSEARYWVDDMFMIPALQVQAYRATTNRVYLERAALTEVAYLDRLQQTNGLFFHAPDVPFYWARGNGWFAAGMTELLSVLPADHPKRARILAGYRKMMSALLTCQGTDGLWRQLLDHPEAWTETSGSGMFTFAMVSGVKHGWLEADTYAPAARKAWLGLVANLDEHDNLRDVCIGTNKKNDLAYYLARERKTGDLHGQAPVLWTAAAFLMDPTPAK